MIIESRINNKARFRYKIVTVDRINTFKYLLNTLEDSSFINISEQMGLSVDQVCHISKTLNKWEKLK